VLLDEADVEEFCDAAPATNCTAPCTETEEVEEVDVTTLEELLEEEGSVGLDVVEIVLFVLAEVWELVVALVLAELVETRGFGTVLLNP